jgi:hypothetical protein
MDAKYHAAIAVATALLSLNRDYDLDFKVDRYQEDSHFRIVLTQSSSYKDNTAEDHVIMINWTPYKHYEVWSDKINSFNDLGDGYPEYNDVVFTDHVKMLSYIHDLLQLYSNNLGKEA